MTSPALLPQPGRPANSPAKRLVLTALERMYRAIGKQVVDSYLAEQSVESLLQTPPETLRAVVARLLQGDAPSPGGLSLEARARLDLLVEAVQSAPNLGGITLEAAAALLADKLSTDAISPASVREFIRRTKAHHELCVHRRWVRFLPDVVLEILSRQRKAKIAGAAELAAAPAARASEGVQPCQ